MEESDSLVNFAGYFNNLTVTPTYSNDAQAQWQAEIDGGSTNANQMHWRSVIGDSGTLASDTNRQSTPTVGEVDLTYQITSTLPSVKYYYLGSQRVAMRGGNEVYYLHGDHLGSTSLTTNVTGTVVAETRHHPFGEVRWESGSSVTDFGFTGQRNESGFGLMDYNARFYSAGLGRFVSADTIVPDFGNSQDLNRYSYVLNNPLIYVDPSGHCGETYSGNSDINASINQDCYDLAEEFGNYAGFDVDYLSQYNIDVLRAVYQAWMMNRAGGGIVNRSEPGKGIFEVGWVEGVGSHIALPPPEDLPVGQPFTIKLHDIGVPDRPQYLLDLVGGGASGISLILAGTQAGLAIAPYVEAISIGADVASILYQFGANGSNAGSEQLKSVGRKTLASTAAQRGSNAMKGMQAVGIVPAVGLYFDILSIRTQNAQRYLLEVVSTSEWSYRERPSTPRGY